MTGSGVNGALLDSNANTGLIHNSLNSGGVLGRYVFSARAGHVDQPPTIAAPGTQTAGVGQPHTFGRWDCSAIPTAVPGTC